jgi:hypothetical protein
VIAHHPVDRLGPFRARFGEPADHLGGVAQREVGPAGVHALGGERDVEVATGRQTGLLEDRHDPLAGRPGVGRGLQHHQLIGLQHLRECLCGVDQRTEIGLAVGRQRCRHAHEDRVGLGQARIEFRE